MLGGEGKKNFFPNFIFSYHLGEKNIFKKDFVWEHGSNSPVLTQKKSKKVRFPIQIMILKSKSIKNSSLK